MYFGMWDLFVGMAKQLTENCRLRSFGAAVLGCDPGSVMRISSHEEKMRERREADKQKEIACKMLKKDLDLALIKEMTGLSEQDLKPLKARI